jgi:antitoxin component YwqK of YwqJK toxin-antitoxin module
MKKILLTLASIALLISANAQDKRTENWPNGNKKSEGRIIGNPVDASSPKEAQARQALNVIKDGKWTNWFENGTIRSEEYYNKGSMIGNWKVWYENGQIDSDINFISGKSAHFYKNGKKQSEGGIADGMINIGKWKGYFENGNLNYEGVYSANGQKEGIWTWYDETGKVTTTQLYKNGELVK